MWEKQLGFARIAEVPHASKLGFALLERDGQQVMFQTRACVEDDLGREAARGLRAITYIDVDSIDEAHDAVKGAEIVVPLRTTSYGAREVFVRDASGDLIAFATHA